MENKELDRELIRQMLDWLNRGVDSDGDSGDAHASFDLALTEEDREFLREVKIAIP